MSQVSIEPASGAEQGIPYTFLNDGHFEMYHLERAGQLLGKASEGGLLLDGVLVEGDVHNPTHMSDSDPDQHVWRGEVKVTKPLSEAQLSSLGELGIVVQPGWVGIAA